MNIKDYKENTRKRNSTGTWMCHITYKENIQDDIWVKIEHYIHGTNRESVDHKVQEHKQKIGINGKEI